MTKARTLFLLPILLTLSGYAAERSVDGNTLYSSDYPAMELTLDERFVFVGRVPFEIEGMATGERLVFIVPGQRDEIERMFIAHFESIYSDDTFNYSFEGMPEVGGLKMRENPFAYSNAEARASNPESESARTMDLLVDQGFTPTDVWLMYRYVSVPDPDRKHEMILFYVEMFYGELSALYRNDRMTPEWRTRAAMLKTRADAVFRLSLHKK